MKKIGFDNDLYIKKQSEQIEKRIGEFGGKLYLEFGGKLFDDFHASRVLPGFAPDAKLRMLMNISDSAEIVIAINASDIESNKMRADVGITYDADVLRLIDCFRGRGLYVGSVVISMFSGQPSAITFKNRLEKQGINVFLHYPIEGYPFDVKKIVSDEGFGKNEYVKTTRPLVVVTAPGPGSGKMAVCLSQLYHENKRGIKAGYAKYETFPIWNLPLGHMVNLAYEAATVDLNDVNMIDPYHLEAYGITAVNYNRDIENFPVLGAILEKIYGECPYKSPTDMGVNMAGYGIIDDEAVKRAASDEIVRRYFKTVCDAKDGKLTDNAVKKMELLMQQAGVSPEDRKVVGAANEKAAVTGAPAAAIELPDGTIVTGKTGKLLGPASAAIINAVKYLAGIDDSIEIISPEVIEPVQNMKAEILGYDIPTIRSDELLIALSVCATTDDFAKRALGELPKLRGCEAHFSVKPGRAEEDVFRKLGINLTCEPGRAKNKLYGI